MYKKNEIVQLKKEFWTVFGQYMSPILSANGERINWINYKTGLKDIFFRMDATSTDASVGLELRHADSDRRDLIFKKLFLFRDTLQALDTQEWRWDVTKRDNFDQPYSAVSRIMKGVSVLDRNSWPAIISFLKPGIITLDAFWSEVKDFLIDQ
jgi:hypothetical protein